jgi:hypothetical protein
MPLRQKLIVRPQCVFRALVRAAFLAAAERWRGPLVLDARRAEAERSAAVRFAAADLACLDNAVRETEVRGSFFSLFTPALERAAETGSCLCPFS